MLVLAPWTIRNAVVLDRFVPVSTGGGKALYIGTYLEADGDGPSCAKCCSPNGRPCARGSNAKARSTTPTAWSSSGCSRGSRPRATRTWKPTPRSAGWDARTSSDDVTEEPLRFAGMLVDKAYDTWTDAARAVMLDQPWRALQLAIVILALAGVAILALRRRRFEALVAGLVLALHDRGRRPADRLAPARAGRPAAARGPRRGVRGRVADRLRRPARG